MKQQQNKSDKKEFWQKQIESARKFPGSQAAFCKANNLSINTFNYYRKKFGNYKKSVPTIAGPFVEVAIKKPNSSLGGRFLPDPKWVADFILHLQKGLR